jgi:alpha-glucosidase
MKVWSNVPVLCVTVMGFSATAAYAVEVKSPDGQVVLSVEVKDFEGAALCPVYSVTYRGKVVVAPSRLGLALATSVRSVPVRASEGDPKRGESRLGTQETPHGVTTSGVLSTLAEGLQIVRQTESSVDTQWKPVCGERSTIRDQYNQVVVELQEQKPPKRLLHLILRAYNEGAAFCYSLPKQPDMERVTISRELTEFRFPADFNAWATYSAQGVYTNVPISQIKRGCERPLVVRWAEDMVAAVAEARLVDYARMKLSPLVRSGPVRASNARVEGVPPSNRGQDARDTTPDGVTTNGLVAELDSEVSSPLPLRTPWRVIMLADSPGQLLERNDIILNLNDACAIADTSWIRPGKVIREVTLSTVGGKACVDFAVKHNLQYVEFDAGWYGPENDDASDARAVHLDPKRSKGPLDLQEVIRYAGERGIGIILYVNHKALERQLDELLPLYQRWGVKGIKFGFVNVGTQKWTSWMHEAIRKAAEHQLMVDVHDEYRPTGWSRTYPNFMTQEGIRGDEERQPNTMSLTTLFTRMLAGAADNTICYYDERMDRQATHAYQLAKAVCFYSPWQFLFWYDRPFVSREVTGRAPDARNVIGDEPELEFFAHCPTVWDDTKVLHGSIGQYAVIARRSGDNWFIGGMNSDEPRSLDVPLQFLDADKKYTAHVYSDDPAVSTRTHVKIERLAVDRGTVLKVVMPARGGQAIRLVPIAKKEEAAEVVTLEPKPLAGVLVNPGKGWSAGGTPDRHPKEVLDLLGMGVMRLDWASVEPQEGQYNWTALERFLDSWGRLGRVCNVGVMCANTHSRAPEGYVTPKWVFDAGAKKIEIMLNPDQSTTGTPGKKVAPVFDDPVFLEKFANFLRAFASRYDGDPRIAVLDIRSYGNWGEAHMHPFGGPDIAPEEFRRHVQMHLDAFKKTQLCLSCNAHLGKFGPLKPIFDWAVLEKHIAPRRDGICGNSDGRETAIGLGIAPGVFELFDNYDGVKKRGWWDGQKDKNGCGFRLEECVENGKPTWVDLGRGGQSGLRMLQENRELIERLTNRIGYHFHLQRAAYPRRAARDGFDLELTWINQGVAPIYIPCEVAVVLLDESGKRVGTVWPQEYDPHQWMPGRPAVEKAHVKCPDTPAGEYRLALALTRKSDDAVPYVRLGTNLPVVDGWYVLGKITVKSP